MKQLLLIGLVISLISCQQATEDASVENKKDSTEIRFTTSDGLEIYGDLYETDQEATTILLFHQGGSNTRGEYSTILPVLIDNGFNVLTIDQRRGGQRYGSYNRTVANIHLNGYGYCDAYPELEGALEFAEASGWTGKKIAWGSSYSASLVIKLAHEYSSQIQGVLAFSPASGEPMAGCQSSEYFATLDVPLLLLRPQSEMEIESVQAQYALAQQNNHQVYTAEHGVHGSSMLVEERTKHNTDATWNVVQSFLERVQGN